MSDVEALAEVLLASPRMLESDYDDAVTDAEAILASDWLAAYVAAERDRAVREAGAQALEDAAKALNTEGLSLKPGGWGSNTADQQILDVLVKTMRWLSARAASLRAALPDDREDHA